MKRFKFFLVTIAILNGGLLTNAQKLIDHIDEKYRGIESIEVRGVFCDVAVEPGNTEEVHLKGEIRGVRAYDDYSINASKSGATLMVEVQHPNSVRGNMKGFLNFEVPQGVELDVINVSGEAEVMNIESSDMNIKTVSGSILVDSPGHNTRLNSISGDIAVRTPIGNLEAQSVSGDLDISDVKGDLSVGSTSGDIMVKMVEGSTKIETASGNISAENLMNGAVLKSVSGGLQSNNIRGSLSVKSVSGDMIIDNFTGSINMKSISGDFQGRQIMLTGNCSFKSVSGDIDVDMENEPETIGCKLKSGSGNLLVGTATNDKKLIFDRGEIEIIGSSVSGDLRFY